MTDKQPKVAVVTGASGNIGRAICERLLDDGWKVYATGRSESELERIYGKYTLAWIVADLHDSKSVAEMMLTVNKRSGMNRLDALVVCHGIAAKHNSFSLPEGEFDEILRINLSSAMWCAKRAKFWMRNKGRVVFIGSIHGTQTYPERAAYAASKAGLEALTRTLALEWGPDGITTNCIAPGHLDIPMKGSPTQDDFLEAVRRRTPTGKLATAEQIASLTTWLLSDDAAQVNGQTIRVDGGLGVSAWPMEYHS